MLESYINHSSSQKEKSLVNASSDFSVQSSLDKVQLKREISSLKNLGEHEYKKKLSLLLDTSKSPPPSMREMLESSVQSSPNSPKLFRSVTKLPNINSSQHTSNILLETHQSRLSTNDDTRITQNPSRNNKLSPLFSVVNCVSRAGFKSRVGKIRGKPKLRGQDAIIIKPYLQNIKGQYLFGISNGHGAQSHLLSAYIKDQLTQLIELALPLEPKADQICKTFTTVLDKVNKSLSEQNIDSVFSGCCLINLIISGRTLVCASLGNCKAIIGRESGQWQEIEISISHTLRNSNERERMISNHARIMQDPVPNKLGIRVERYYLGNQDVPGLEVTRSLGDKIGKFIGNIAVPECRTFTLQPQDKFIIIGSEGFWRCFSELEVMCIVRLSWGDNKIDQSCEDLVNEAERRGRNDNGDMDDLTVIVVYLNVQVG